MGFDPWNLSRLVYTRQLEIKKTKKLKSYLGFTAYIDIYTHIRMIPFWNKKSLFSFRLGYNLGKKPSHFSPGQMACYYSKISPFAPSGGQK